MAESMNLRRGWLRTTRFENNTWTRHGTNYFLGPQCGLGCRMDARLLFRYEFVRTLPSIAIWLVLIPRSCWVTGAVRDYRHRNYEITGAAERNPCEDRVISR